MALVFLIFVSLVDLVGPALIGYGIDKYIAPKTQTLTEAQRSIGLLEVASIYLLVLIIGLVLRYLHVLLLSIIGQRIMLDMRSQMFDHLQRLSLSYFDHNPVGRLMTRLTNDIDALNEMFTSGAISILGDVLTIIGITILLLVINWQLALVTFVVLPPLFWIASYFRVAMRDNFRAIRVRLARINAYIAENIGGMYIVQLFNREQRNFERFDDLNRDYLHQTIRSILYFISFSSITNFLSAVAVALIIWYGGGRVLVGALTIGALVAYLQYVDRFFLPVRDLAEKYNILQSAMASSERIFKVLDESPTIQDPSEPVEFCNVQGEIEFRDVWFAYNTGDWVLKGISFKIRPGERVFIRTPLTSGYADYALAREVAVGKLPDSIPFVQAAILQLLPLAVHATRGVRLGDRVLIIGQGPVGLMALQVVRLRGASFIAVTDLDPWRLECSSQLSADTFIAHATLPKEILRGEWDVAIDAVGTQRTLQSCMDAVRPTGIIVLLGTHHVDTHVSLDLVQWEKKSVQVQSSAEPHDEARREALRVAEQLVNAKMILSARSV